MKSLVTSDIRHIEEIILRGMPEWFGKEAQNQNLSDFLAKQQRLRVLDIAQNSLQSHDLERICYYLRNSLSLGTLQEIYIGTNYFDSQALNEQLSALIDEAPNLAILTLDKQCQERPISIEHHVGNVQLGRLGQINIVDIKTNQILYNRPTNRIKFLEIHF